MRKQNLFEAELRLVVAARWEQRQDAVQQLRALAGAFALFSQEGHVTWERSRIRRYRRAFQPFLRRGFLLSSADVSRLWHPTTKTVNAPTLAVTESRRLEPAPDFASRQMRRGDMLLGRTTFRGEGHPVRLGLQDRLRHVLMIGRTGTGKSTLMENMFLAEMQAGNGCCLIDPHGDLFETVQTLVPSDRIGDVVSFDVADRQHPLGFNILDCSDPDRFALVADGGVSAFKKVFGLSEAETPRLISILRNSLLTLVEMPGTTLLDIGRLLTEEPYRALAIRRVSNPVVKNYWVHRFGKWTRSERTKAVEAVLNKVDSFATTPLLQKIVGQPRNGLDLRRAMDEGQIVLVNLSKGRVGEDAANMLGSLLVTQLQLDAMSRADIPPHDRRPFFVYIDEFQNFATESFPAILSEARKFGLGLIAAHQYLDQVPRETAKAVFGNVGTLISFQVGADDAELLARQFSRDRGDIQERDLINLPRYHALVRLLVDGMPTRRLTMETCAPPERQSRVTADAIRFLFPEAKARSPAVAASMSPLLTKESSSSPRRRAR
ncbi:MAG: type IV secretion system DNA-binding domain-containing protein [Planctomycetes bacterium]|nr:type IV secretion system DNA-binding domain-containing protein [Planctomycetota bacterium]